MSDGDVEYLMRELTDDEKKRARFARVYRCKWISVWGPRWGRGIGLAMATMNRDQRDDFLRVLEDGRVGLIQRERDLRTTFDALTNIFKKHNVLLSRHWKIFVNVETLGGYQTTPNMKSISEHIHKWVSTQSVHRFPGDGDQEALWLRKFGQYVYDWLLQAPNVTNAIRRLRAKKDFTNMPGLWAVSGSSSTPASIRYSYKRRDGKIVEHKVRKTKWGTAIGNGPAFVSRLLNPSENTATQTIKLVLKSETGKVRPVGAVGDNSYIPASVLFRFLDMAFKNHPRTSLYFDAKHLVQMYNDMGLGFGKDVQLPIDVSKFDWRVTFPMLSVIHAMIGRWLRQLASREPKLAYLVELNSLVTRLITSKGQTIRIVDPSNGKDIETVEVKSGLISGLRGTAFYGSIISGVLSSLSSEWLERYKIGGRLIKRIAQGDDQMLTTNSYAYAAGTVEAMNAMGWPVNPSKFFVSTQYTEYLRQVGSEGSVCGYHCRSINALLWRNPVSRDPPAGILRAREICMQWSSVIGRGGDREECIRLMKSDISGATGTSEEIVTGLMITPACLGGLGCQIDFGSQWYSLTAGVRECKAHLNFSTIPGLDWEREELSKLGMKLTDVSVERAVFSRVELVSDAFDVVHGDISPIGLKLEYDTLDRVEKRVPKPVMNDAVPITLGQAALYQAIQSRDYKWIRETYLNTESQAISDHIEKRGGRAVWLGWLQGNLPFVKPVILGYSSLAVASEYSIWEKSAWAVLMTRARFTMDTVRRLAVSCEIMTARGLRSSFPKLGG